LKQIFAGLGEVEEIREHWDKNFIFVLYKLPADALTAKRTIAQFPERCVYISKKSVNLIIFCRSKLIEGIRAQVLKKGDSLLFVPKTSFYVRWPRKETPEVHCAILPCYNYALLILKSGTKGGRGKERRRKCR